MNHIFQPKALLVLSVAILGGILLYVGVSRTGNESASVVAEPLPAAEEMDVITNSDVSTQEESSTTTVVSVPSPEVAAPATPKPAPVVELIEVEPTPIQPVVEEEPVLVPEKLPGITMTEVARHTNVSSCWSVINGGVYDLTTYIPRHPGGKSEILAICGKDGSRLFEGQHSGDSKPEKILAGFYIDVLVE